MVYLFVLILFKKIQCVQENIQHYLKKGIVHLKTVQHVFLKFSHIKT